MFVANSFQPTRAQAGVVGTLATLVLVIVAMTWVKADGLAVRGLEGVGLSMALLAGNALLFRGRIGGDRAADLATACALFTAFASASALLSYLAFRIGAPLADARLAAWDQAIGFDWQGWAAFVTARPSLQASLHFAYQSMSVQILAALVLLPLSGMATRCDEFLAVLMFALVPTLVFCAILPAEGAGVYFGLTDPAHYLDAQRALRSGALTELQLGALQGIVTFPSFHTITAVALIRAARGTPLALLAWVLDSLMILSTPTEGWHYLVDVLAGLSVAFGSIALSKWTLGMRVA